MTYFIIEIIWNYFKEVKVLTFKELDKNILALPCDITFTARIPKKSKKRLDSLAKKHKLSRGAIIAILLDNYK